MLVKVWYIAHLLVSLTRPARREEEHFNHPDHLFITCVSFLFFIFFLFFFWPPSILGSIRAFYNKLDIIVHRACGVSLPSGVVVAMATGARRPYLAETKGAWKWEWPAWLHDGLRMIKQRQLRLPGVSRPADGAMAHDAWRCKSHQKIYKIKYPKQPRQQNGFIRSRSTKRRDEKEEEKYKKKRKK